MSEQTSLDDLDAGERIEPSKRRAANRRHVALIVGISLGLWGAVVLALFMFRRLALG